MRATPSRRAAAALVLGALSVSAFAPLYAYPIPWLTLAGLFLLGRRDPRPRDGAATGFAFGLGFFGVGVSWVYVSMHDVGGMPMPVAAFAALLFCTVLTLFHAAAGYAFVRWRPAGWGRQVAWFAVVLTLADWSRGWVFTGFPWLAFGYSQSPPSPLAGFAPVVGAYGLTLLTALVAGGVAAAAATRRWQPLALAAAVPLAGALLGQVAWTVPVGAPISVALLQGNIEQDLKWRPEHFLESLRTYHRLMVDHPARLTVFPETALPSFYDQLPPDYLETLRSIAIARGGDVVFGTVVGDAARYTNAAVTFGVSAAQRYDKSHLVPFGEFVPPGFSWFLTLMQVPMSDFARGAPVQAPLEVAGQRLAPNICYEDVFGAEIIRALPAATLLVNLSNTAWFGRSLAQPQHLQIAQLRSLETGRMTLRATNTGMTAIVGADGVVRAVLPAFSRDALVGEAQGYAGVTPYVRAGDAGVLALCVLLAVAARGGRRRDRSA